MRRTFTVQFKKFLQRILRSVNDHQELLETIPKLRPPDPETSSSFDLSQSDSDTSYISRSQSLDSLEQCELEFEEYQSRKADNSP